MKNRPEIQGEQILEALDQAPFGRQHGVFLGALLAALVFDYMKPATLGFVVPGIRQAFHLSPTEASYLAVAGLTGTMVGALFWGIMADRIGRRPILLWTVGIFSVASLCGFALDYWNSLFMCFIMGTGVGGEAPLVFALAAEYIPARVRGRAILLLGIVGSTGGYALAAATSAVVKSFYPEEFAWRLLWLVGVVPAALILVLRSKIVPESARYLIARGRIGEARIAAERLVGRIAEGGAAPQRKQEVAAPATSTYYGRTVALGVFSFAAGLANFGFITWLPTLLTSLGYTGAVSSAYLALSALIALPALALTALLFTQWSSRSTLVLYAVGGGLTLGALGLAGAGNALAPALLIGVTSIALFFISSIGGAFPLYTAELYPTAIRAQRAGLVSAVGRLGGIVGPYAGGLLLAAGQSPLALYAVLGAVLLVGAANLHLAGVETRGKTLEQITFDARGHALEQVRP